MRIGIILNPYDEDKPAGLARMIFELTNSMIANDSVNEYIIFLKRKPKILPNFPGDNWRVEVLGYGIFWLELGLRIASKADVYIFNTPVVPITHTPGKIIVLALDFAYKYLPANGFLANLKKFVIGYYHSFSLRKADKIVAISEATKKDTVKFFGISEKKVEVIYCGYKKICQLPQQKIKVPEKFFLFVGVIKERKNVFNIVRAYNDFQKKNGNDYKLVIGGKNEGGYYEKIKEYINKENIGRDVIFLGYFSDKQLSYLYQKASALVFPSLIEGFGFPALEAMDCSLPVITSNISSLAELGSGGSAILVNPDQPEEISAAMEKLVKDTEFRKHIIQKGLEQSKKFSWSEAAQEMQMVINSLF